MNKLNRIKKLVDLIKLSGGKIRSRKKIHKLVYILQEIGEDFNQDFYYHNYGVFSSTLASDLDYAKAPSVEFIVEEEGEGSGFQYIIGENSKYLNEFESKVSFENQIDDLKDYSPSFLEALSTIIYLYRNHYAKEFLKPKFKELKPHLLSEYKQALEIFDKYF